MFKFVRKMLCFSSNQSELTKKAEKDLQMRPMLQVEEEGKQYGTDGLMDLGSEGRGWLQRCSASKKKSDKSTNTHVSGVDKQSFSAEKLLNRSSFPRVYICFIQDNFLCIHKYIYIHYFFYLLPPNPSYMKISDLWTTWFPKSLAK